MDYRASTRQIKFELKESKPPISLRSNKSKSQVDKPEFEFTGVCPYCICATDTSSLV